jgi:hypothetical protein
MSSEEDGTRVGILIQKKNPDILESWDFLG